MKSRYVALDFETTGASWHNGEVIEIAAARCENGVQVEAFEVLLKPSIPVDAGALAVHGLTDAHLAEHGQDPAVEWPKLHAFLGDDPLVAHNGLGFDYPFMHKAFGRYGLAHASNRLLDSVRLSRAILGRQIASHSLASLCAHFKLPRIRAHRAMSDVIDVCGVLNHLIGPEHHDDLLWDMCGRTSFHTMLGLPEHLDVIRRAMVEGLEVQIEYRLKSGSVSRRWIRPLRLEGRPNNVHIRSICGFDGSEKSFLPAGILAILGTRGDIDQTSE